MIKYTEEMLNKKVDTTFLKMDRKEFNKLKKSQWQRYRIVQRKHGEEVSYFIEYVTTDLSFGLPRFLGGKGLFPVSFYWTGLPDYVGNKWHSSYEKASKAVVECLERTKQQEEKVVSVVKETIMSWWPNDVITKEKSND